MLIMKGVTGYAVSIAGLGVMAVGFNMIPVKWEILNIVPTKYVSGVGLALVGIGIFIALMDKGGRKGKNGEDEVPIYEGVGRSRRVVGYRKVK